MASEGQLIRTLEDLKRKLNRKQSFEEAVASLREILQESYPSSPPSIYSVISRVSTVLKTRYTASGYWLSGLRLFEEAERLVTKPSEKEHLTACATSARQYLLESENQSDAADSAQNNTNSRFLFEGHLTVGAEPPPPAWLVAQNVLTALAVTQELGDDGAGSSQTLEQLRESANAATSVYLQEVVNSIEGFRGLDALHSAIETSLQEIGAGPEKPPPASKEVVAKLPIIEVTDEILSKLGKETECAVCRENLVANDMMQEMPCKHLFHPICLKPWLDEHNSCPICRFELPTDDYAYESRKEKEKEEEEERKGAANAVRGGEYMYV
ncbi:E3 ubiquitin-protein ligase [Nymphaea thermarum]|nr:E3 ubiquitin-protein ligase [Nymphaea thermarum]